MIELFESVAELFTGLGRTAELLPFSESVVAANKIGTATKPMSDAEKLAIGGLAGSAVAGTVLIGKNEQIKNNESQQRLQNWVERTIHDDTENTIKEPRPL